MVIRELPVCMLGIALACRREQEVRAGLQKEFLCQKQKCTALGLQECGRVVFRASRAVKAYVEHSGGLAGCPVPRGAQQDWSTVAHDWPCPWCLSAAG